MNTGVRRSGATPFGAATTTSPSGEASFGKAQQRKDMTAIAVAHHVPYAAQAAASHWRDLSEKEVERRRRRRARLPERAHGLPRRLGSRAETRSARPERRRGQPLLAVVRVVDGRYRLTHQPETVVPVEEWLRRQKRFAHLLRPENAGLVEEIQRRIDADWEDPLRRCEGGDLP